MWCSGTGGRKRNTLRCGHIKRKNGEEFVEIMYVSESVGLRRREKPVVRWKDWVKEYMHERVADRWEEIELATKECLDGKRPRLFCSSYPFWRMLVV